MGQKEKDYMHDPATGRKLTARERLDRLRTPFADQTIVDAAPVAAQSLAERQKQRKAADEMAREVAAKVAAKAAENLPPVNPFAARAAELQAKLETVAPHERASYERRLSLFVQEAERWAAERAAEARRASFLADPGIVTMGENAAADRLVEVDAGAAGVRIGRAAGMEVPLPFPAISALHAVICSSPAGSSSPPASSTSWSCASESSIRFCSSSKIGSRPASSASAHRSKGT